MKWKIQTLGPLPPGPSDDFPGRPGIPAAPWGPVGPATPWGPKSPFVPLGPYKYKSKYFTKTGNFRYCFQFSILIISQIG